MDKQIKVKNIPAEVKIQQPDLSRQDDRFNPRNRIYVRAVKGLHQLLRQRIGFLGMLAFMLLPWINFNGQQAVLFDLVGQKYNIFGLTLWPQDFTILAFIFMLAAFALFLVTTFYGRVWCGYTCPQTVWTFIFIWFEEKFEGTANQRKKLINARWTLISFGEKQQSTPVGFYLPYIRRFRLSDTLRLSVNYSLTLLLLM